MLRTERLLHVPQDFLCTLQSADRINEAACLRPFALIDWAGIVDHVDAHRRWLDGTDWRL